MTNLKEDVEIYSKLRSLCEEIAKNPDIKITLTNNTGSRVFVTEGTGKELAVTETNSGKEIHVPSFRQFYFALLSTGVDGYSEFDAGVNTETLEHNLTFEIEISKYRNNRQ